MTEPDFRKTLRLLALMTWMVYAATSTGTLSIDPKTRFDVAEAVVQTGGVALDYDGTLTVEHDGGQYSIFFPGQSLLFLPAAGLGVALSKVFGWDPNITTLAARFVSCVFFMTSFTVLSLLGHVAVLRQLGVRPRLALGSGAILAFGTPVWIWGTNGSEEAILGAIGIWVVWALLDARRIGASDVANDQTARRLADRLGLAGVLLACGLAHRATFVTIVAGALVIALPIVIARRRLLAAATGRLAAWVLLATVIVSLVPLYNWLRFGDPLDTGYGRFYADIGGVFATPVLTGLRGHLLSPGKGIFLYAPWLILLPIAACSVAVWRRMGSLGLALTLIVVLHLLIYSTHTFWSGAFGWGVRFHVSLLPLLLVPIGVWLQTTRVSHAARRALIVLGVASCLVQVAGSAFNMGLEHFQRPQDYTGPPAYPDLIPDEAAWTWRGSPLRLRFVNIARKLGGEELLADEPDEERRRIVDVWNLFPIRSQAALYLPVINTGLWLLWAALLIMAGVFGNRAFRRWQRVAAEEGS